MTKPSRTAVRKARLHRLFKEQKERDQYLKVLKITGIEVLFRYGGHEIGFRYEKGRVTRDGFTYRYLSDEDWVFLFRLAEELMQAAFAGYKKATMSGSPPSKVRQLSFRF